jgi:hypothetical protein
MYRYMIFGKSKYTKPSAKLGIKSQDFKCEGRGSKLQNRPRRLPQSKSRDFSEIFSGTQNYCTLQNFLNPNEVITNYSVFRSYAPVHCAHPSFKLTNRQNGALRGPPPPSAPTIAASLILPAIYIEIIP